MSFIKNTRLSPTANHRPVSISTERFLWPSPLKHDLLSSCPECMK